MAAIKKEDTLPLHIKFFTKEKVISQIIFSFSKKCTWEVVSEMSPKSQPNSSLRKEIDLWMERYLLKKSDAAPLPLDLSSFSLFSRSALKAIQEVTFGEQATYKEIGEKIGCPRGARAIGGVCRRNRFPLVIPCHRIIASDQGLGGFAFGLDIKEKMLAFEKRS
ncbi:MAG: MGMT family protein [Simkania negevensis]|nr:MGMT family protein [Simkania negevensis]